jgi:hypothetical protein
MNFVQIPPATLTGLVLPSFFREDYFSDEPINYHIAWLKRFAEENSLRVEWHDADPEYNEYYKMAGDQLNNNNTMESEQEWVTRDTDESSIANILHKAYENRNKYKQASGKARIREIIANSQPISVIATAAVKLAIKKWMTDLTASNYTSKYQLALTSAMEYFVDALLPSYKIRGEDGELTKTGKEQMVKLFDYYCPDAPEDEDTE